MCFTGAAAEPLSHPFMVERERIRMIFTSRGEGSVIDYVVI